MRTMDNETKKIRYFSMFTGVGGFELGFEEEPIKPEYELDALFG